MDFKHLPEAQALLAEEMHARFELLNLMGEDAIVELSRGTVKYHFYNARHMSAWADQSSMNCVWVKNDLAENGLPRFFVAPKCLAGD